MNGRLADDFRRLLYEIDSETDRLIASGDEVVRQIGFRIQEHVRRLQRLADELGAREWKRGGG
jgi:hypothetical protein